MMQENIENAVGDEVPQEALHIRVSVKDQPPTLVHPDCQILRPARTADAFSKIAKD